MKKYKPYKGGGGPTDKQQEDNTKFLAELLTLIEVPFKENRSRMKELCGKDILLLEIKMSKNTMYIGYDRWGFVLENEKKTLYPFEDQAPLQDTLLTILKYYKR